MDRENSMNELNEHSLNRRDALKGVAAVSLGVATGAYGASEESASSPPSSSPGRDLIRRENEKPGTRDWMSSKRIGRNHMNVTTRRVSRRRWRSWIPLLAYLAVSLHVFGEKVKMPAATDLHSHGVTQAQIESLSEIMRQAVQQELIAGCSFLVAHKGEIVYRKAFGYANIESKRLFTTDELIMIASVSKSFLATVLMVLVEQGKVKLDDPVEKYLPEFKGKRVEGSQSPARPMTVRQLLSHTAGFWGNKKITPEKRALIRNFEQTLAESVKGIAKYDLVYEPGTRWLYSGSGYCVAGRVAEVALDQSLEEIAQDALFHPLGLSRTTYMPSKEVRKTMPTRYLRQNGKLQKQSSSRAEIERRFILAGGSLNTTLDDMAVFGQMHLNDGVYNGKRILSKASVTEMRRLQSPKERWKSYGLGWFRGDVSESGLADLVFHNGALGAHLRVDRRREVVCVFLVHQTALQSLDQKNKLLQQVNEMFPVPNGR